MAARETRTPSMARWDGHGAALRARRPPSQHGLRYRATSASCANCHVTPLIRLLIQAWPENRPEGECLKTERRYEEGRLWGPRQPRRQTQRPTGSQEAGPWRRIGLLRVLATG